MHKLSSEDAVENMSCAVCSGQAEKNERFFLDAVCGTCHEELKRISRGERSYARKALVYYVEAHARFLHKNPCPADPLFIGLLSVGQLIDLCEWLKEISRWNLA